MSSPKVNKIKTPYHSDKIKNFNKFFNLYFSNNIILTFNENVTVIRALKFMYGYSYSTTIVLLNKLGFNENSRISEISFNQWSLIIKILIKFSQNQKFLISIKNSELSKFQLFDNYKGFRHMHGLPANGQRTRSNAKTCRSLSFHSNLIKLIKQHNNDQV